MLLSVLFLESCGRLATRSYRFLIALHVDRARCFSVFPVFDQGSVHEHVVLRLVLFCCVVCCFASVLLFERTCVPVSDGVGLPPSSVVFRAKCVSSNVFRVNGTVFALFVHAVLLVVCSDLGVEVSYNKSVCVCRLVSVGCAFGARSILVASVRLQIPWEVERGSQQSEPLFLDGHSRESWSAVLHTLLMCSVHI